MIRTHIATEITYAQTSAQRCTVQLASLQQQQHTLLLLLYNTTATAAISTAMLQLLLLLLGHSIDLHSVVVVNSRAHRLYEL
jgi:hypothetical protein